MVIEHKYICGALVDPPNSATKQKQNTNKLEKYKNNFKKYASIKKLFLY